MIIYQSRFLTRGEVWFDNPRTSDPVDWVVYHQRSQPVPKGSFRPFYTRIIDLKQSPDVLVSQMDGFTAADIRKAEKKDQTVGQLLSLSNRDVLPEFYAFYDHFAACKHLPPANRHWLERTAEAGKLHLWSANSSEGQRLAYHVFYHDTNRVRSLHSASLYTEASSKEAQRKIGRANRFLIWLAALHYREQGIEVFDLGGWYNGTDDAALLGINKFKEGFGGSVICEYEGEQLVTLKSWCVVTTARLLEKFKSKSPINTDEPPKAPELRALTPSRITGS